MRSMKKVGFTAEEINDVKSAPAAILYIGEFRLRSVYCCCSQIHPGVMSGVVCCAPVLKVMAFLFS